MLELKTAIISVEIVAAVAATILLGSLLGYRIGRLRLAIIVGAIVLVAIIAFAVYAAIVLT
ncbi:MAG: hypothetical protein CO103_07470 [Chloroflexi bacterium CG_4_9_14_3_um_filter_45_9]|nr:MAG: hypothetical protein AUK00_02040 [Dehalococcoidia bacterium CG2_30_46_9]PIX27847.1 MAG: hypothetical protein COZ67_00125 [Chloroflexi bacterium CG_4_8_14_3_um_filter_45_15]PJB48336.1 MAG: hypothetical protein CO103_07470 [Chloroflexi bacterium CG_4_9_14_3_um_filter_45_9]